MQDKLIRKNLITWYLKNQRDLPWRKSLDPYAIWISEAMLQQTQVTTVIPYFNRFLQQFPDIHTLALADLETVLKAWEGMGYYARARNLHRAAIEIVDQLDGKIPSSFKQLKKLPGVGDYIAAAVSSIAFQKPNPVVDGNVKRVLSRMFLIETPVNDASAHRIFYQHALKFVDNHVKDHQGIFNQAIMELGALICRPRNADCIRCPVVSCCQAFKQNLIHQFPMRNKKRKPPEYQVSAAVLRKNEKILITRRKLEGHLGGLWEFPGGKVHENETPEQACIREIKEEVNLDISIDTFLTRVKHAYTHFKISMDIFNCTYVSGDLKLNGPVDFRWVTADELELYPFPGADRKFMHLLTSNSPQVPL
jgi:A/G-specific adenine glycosylase